MARRRSRWNREKLRSFHAGFGLPYDGPMDSSASFERAFASRNILGLTLDSARRNAERELAGEPPEFPSYSFGLSTGSLGVPGVFLTSERERSAWVGSILGKFVPVRLLLGSDVALILKHNNRLYTDATRTRGIRLHYFDAACPVAEWLPRLCELAPQILIGPPSVLEEVALSTDFARRPFRPSILLAGAEPLFPQDAELLNDAFTVEPRVIYQAKEGFLAAGCEFGNTHLNEDLVYFEAIELSDRRVIPVITDFTRTSQIYRRYRLDDVLVPHFGACPCGQPFATVDAVEGRANDVLLLPMDKPVFPLQVNTALMPLLPAISGRKADFCLTQSGAGEFRLAMEGGAKPDQIAVVSSLLDQAPITTEDYQPPKPGEKRRRIRRLFDSGNAWLTAYGDPTPWPAPEQSG